jgi:hypothetical protein
MCSLTRYRDWGMGILNTWVRMGHQRRSFLKYPPHRTSMCCHANITHNILYTPYCSSFTHLAINISRRASIADMLLTHQILCLWERMWRMHEYPPWHRWCSPMGETPWRVYHRDVTEAWRRFGDVLHWWTVYMRCNETRLSVCTALLYIFKGLVGDPCPRDHTEYCPVFGLKHTLPIHEQVA